MPLVKRTRWTDQSALAPPNACTIVGKAHYDCANTRITIRRDEPETRVLSGLKDRSLHPDRIAKFVNAYRQECNRLSAEATMDKAKAEQEPAKVTHQIARIIEAITDGMFRPSMKGKMDEQEVRGKQAFNRHRTSISSILQLGRSAPLPEVRAACGIQYDRRKTVAPT